VERRLSWPGRQALLRVVTLWSQQTEINGNNFGLKTTATAWRGQLPKKFARPAEQLKTNMEIQ
jgi:hypothetical protein